MTLGKELPVDVLKSHAALLRESPALPQRISQGSPLRIPVRRQSHLETAKPPGQMPY
jgi:hypothetical protein